MDQAKRGGEALTVGNYAEAVKQFTAALKVSPTSPDYFVKRSMAHQRSSPANYKLALSDAEKAVVFAQKRAKRELIVQAQLRRGIALFGLERYGDAKFVFDVVKRMEPKEKTLAIWESKIATKLAALAEDDAKRVVTAKETPDVTQAEEPAEEDSISHAGDETEAPSAAIPSAESSKAPPKPALITFRQDWFQSNEFVTFTLLAKGVDKNETKVEIEPLHLSISFPAGRSEEGEDVTNSVRIDPLYKTIDPSQSSFKVLPTKIEVQLKKAQPGIKWASIEAKDTDEIAPPISSANAPANPSASAPAGPYYPTSSRTGPKNWDKLADELTASKKKPTTSTTISDKDKGKGKAASASKDDEDDDDYDYDAADNGGDEVNSFFQKLYSGADPDTRRAMMKSFSESNGTALSTNWEEVSKKKMETTPPDGMVAKKY